MPNKLFYYDNQEEYESDREKAIGILKDAGFNEEVLQEEIRDSQTDYGDEFFWTIVHCPGKLERWMKNNGVSEKKDARNFVLYCLDFA